MKSRGPGPTPAERQTGHFWSRPRPAASDASLCSSSRTETSERSITDWPSEGGNEPCQQDVVIDGIKGCGQVIQGNDRQVAIID